MSAVLRFEVPVDDAVHSVPCGSGPILHVGCRQVRVLEFWKTVHEGHDTAPAVRHFVAVGTGQQLPPGGSAVGSALSPRIQTARSDIAAGALVWHLVEVPTAGSTE